MSINNPLDLFAALIHWEDLGSGPDPGSGNSSEALVCQGSKSKNKASCPFGPPHSCGFRVVTFPGNVYSRLICLLSRFPLFVAVAVDPLVNSIPQPGIHIHNHSQSSCCVPKITFFELTLAFFVHGVHRLFTCLTCFIVKRLEGYLAAAVDHAFAPSAHNTEPTRTSSQYPQTTERITHTQPTQPPHTL